MSGLVCTQTRTDNVELVAADEAYTRWRDGDFVPDGQNWRFFTGQVEIRFFNSRSRGEEWEMVDNFNPITHVAYVAAYLQREYDRLRVH